VRATPAILDPFWHSEETAADHVSKLIRSEFGKRILKDYLKDLQSQGLFIGLLTELEARVNPIMQHISETRETLLSLLEDDTKTSSIASSQDSTMDVESLSLTGQGVPKSSSPTELSNSSKMVTFSAPSTNLKRSYSQRRTY